MNLQAETRDVEGKSLQKLRLRGLIPAELYGNGLENIHVSLPGKEFIKAFKEGGSTTVITLDVGGKKIPVIVHDVQRNFVNDEIVHVDLYQIQSGQKIKAHVPIELTGEAPAVRDFGGVVNKAMNEVEVEALPENLPHSFTLSLESLKELGQSLHVRDLKVAKGVEIHAEPEAVIASVAEPQAEEEVPVVASVESVVVEAEEKKAERVGVKDSKEAAEK